ncbi:MAG: hypothetical protein LUE14_04035 [Clostridiales bacterium]|nr:hypothetical protein [Clostridiales bacterium]
MKKFEIGTVLVICGLYTGDYLEKVIGRTETEVICQEINYPDSEPNRHQIEYDSKQDSERFLNWEYKGETSYVYPDSTPENIYG